MKKLLFILVASGTLSLVAASGPAGNYGAMTKHQMKQLGKKLQLEMQLEKRNEEFEEFEKMVTRQIQRLALEDLIKLKSNLAEEDLSVYDEDEFINKIIFISSVDKQIKKLQGTNRGKRVHFQGEYTESE